MAKFAAPFLRTAYNYDMFAASEDSALRCDDVSLAKQEFLEECDINTIVKRFGIGYELPTGASAPTFGDFTDVVDFQSAMNVIVAARESFMELSGESRARFNNDPQRFVEFCSDPSNGPELVKLGFALPREEAIVAPPAP